MINVACPCLQPAQYRPAAAYFTKLGKSGTRRSPDRDARRQEPWARSALPPPREAIATTSAVGVSLMAGMVRVTAIMAVPRTPQRTGSSANTGPNPNQDNEALAIVPTSMAKRAACRAHAFGQRESRPLAR